MSITTTSTKDSYTGNNSTSTPYPITFKYLEDSHITVYVDGVALSNSYYTLTGDGSLGTGQFTTALEYASTQKVVVVLDFRNPATGEVELDQPVELLETGALSSSTLEEAYDRLNMQIRRVWRKAQDVLTFSSDEGGAGSTGTANTLLGFDGSGDLGEIPNSTFVESSGGINNISDVTITSPSNGEGLAWNGSAWVNSATGNGDAFVSNPLSQFASTTSLQLKNTITDETGSGALVFATSPTLVTPALGTPSAIDLTNATNYPETNGTVQGTGATTLNIVATDEGTVAGNARGENSVDLQTERTLATEVASGDQSAIIGGKNNTAIGASSFVGGGNLNTASGLQSFVGGGNANSATAQYSGVLAGVTNTAGGNNSFVMGGYGNTASGARATVMVGATSTASGDDSLAVGGNVGASHRGAKMFGSYQTGVAFDSKIINEFGVQCDNFRLELGTPAVGDVLTCNHTDGSSEWSAPAKVVYTVATLPATPAQGDVAMVTDATATTFHSIVAGTGSNIVPVFNDGTNWRIG